MVTKEPVVRTEMRRVVRCDKCCKVISDDYDKRCMRVVTFRAWSDGKVTESPKYHLCEECAYSLQWEYDSNRKRVREGITPAEQTALLADLFVGDRKKRRRCRWLPTSHTY